MISRSIFCLVWSLLWKSVKSVDALLAQIFPCFVMPNSALLIDIIKNLARGCQEAGCSEVNVAVVQTLSATYEILGRFFSFPASKDRSSSGSISAGLWGSRRNKHTPTPPLAVVWLLDGKGAECCLLNRSGWMHGWMGDRRG